MESSAPNTPNNTNGSPAFWARAGTFIAENVWKIVAGVLGAAAVAIFVPMIVSAWDRAVLGDAPPVIVRVDLEPNFEDMTLPDPTPLTEAELQELNSLGTDTYDWFVEKKSGILAGQRQVVLTLQGNRPEMVRVTDVQADAECGAPPRGVLMRQGFGRGGAPESLQANIDLDDPDEAAELDPDTAEPRSYFPEKTITLEKDEEEVLIVDLAPVDEPGIMCEVALVMTVVDDGVEEDLRILNDGEKFRIMQVEPYEDAVESQYAAVYLGGYVCREFVPAPANWIADPAAACGPGNSGVG